MTKSKNDNFIYLKSGSNILRIDLCILKGKKIDYSKYLEVLVYDGYDKYHFEKNEVSVCIAEDFDIKQLQTTDNPIANTSFHKVRLNQNARCNASQLHVKHKVKYVPNVSKKKRTKTISTKDVAYVN